jgi:hypothetical protein
MRSVEIGVGGIRGFGSSGFGAGGSMRGYTVAPPRHDVDPTAPAPSAPLSRPCCDGCAGGTPCQGIAGKVAPWAIAGFIIAAIVGGWGLAILVAALIFAVPFLAKLASGPA